MVSAAAGMMLARCRIGDVGSLCLFIDNLLLFDVIQETKGTLRLLLMKLGCNSDCTKLGRVSKFVLNAGEWT